MSQAVFFDAFGVDQLKVQEHEAPVPGPNEVKIKVLATSINYRDLMMVKGLYNPKLNMPLIPLSDGAGEVIAVGSEVSDLAVGDRVCSTMIPDWETDKPAYNILKTTLGGPAHGLLAQERTLPRNAVLKVPQTMDPAEAACLPVAGLTAWSALVTEGKITKDSKVLLLGTGGVSIMALGIAKAMGASVVITSSSDEKLTRARELGADHTINYRTYPQWAKQVLGIYPEGVDVVVEVGGAGTFNQSVRATRLGGCIALMGVLAQPQADINLTSVLMKRIQVQGILVGSRSEFRDYIQFVEKHQLHPVIDRKFAGLASAQEAFQFLADGAHFGKVVILP